MAKRIYKALKANGIDTTLETIETIINGNGTKADGDICDIIETLADVNEYGLIDELYAMA